MTIADAAIKTLPSTPVLMVAAPGSGFMLVPVVATFSAHTAAGAYTNITAWPGASSQSGTLRIAWDALVNSNTASGIVRIDNLLGTTTPRLTTVGFIGNDATNFSVGAAVTDLQNLGATVQASLGYDNATLSVVAQNALGALTGGNAANTLVVTLLYFVAQI